jgi:hypothetical protein
MEANSVVPSLFNATQFSGKQIPISSPSDYLTPTIRVKKINVEVNFGDNPAKPFKFDINKCQGLVFQ